MFTPGHPGLPEVPLSPDGQHVPSSDNGRVITNPYPGLRPFEEEDSAFFFGRVQQISDLLGRLSHNRFLAVIGVSGSGKSSLIRAGLIPVLRQGFLASTGDRWRTVLFRPGKAPVSALATALNRSLGASDAENALEDKTGGLLEITDRLLDLRENLLVVVDQFEEIFRYKHLTRNESDERTNAVAEASALVSLIINALEDRRVHVIITMRSDYLGDCAQFNGLPEEINRGQYLIPRLSADEQREIIVRPAWVHHVQVSELLVQTLLDDVGPEPEQLPILQHALSQVWKNWDTLGAKGTITVKHLANVGGFDQSMDKHAEKVYKSLASPKHQWVAKRLFQRITLQGTSERPIRRAETLRDLRSIISDIQPDVEANRILLEVISSMRHKDVEFLTTPEVGELNDESVIDISHESLCWLWTRLASWIEEEAESADLYLRISKLALLYITNNKQQGLYTDPGLTYVMDTYHPSARSSLNPETVTPWSEAWSRAYNKAWKETKEYLDQSKLANTLRTVRRAATYILIFLCILLLTTLILFTGGKRADDLSNQAEFQRSQLGAATQERAALLAIKSRKTQPRPSNSDLASWESFERIVRGTSINQLPAPVTQLFMTEDQHIVAITKPLDPQNVPRPLTFEPWESGQRKDPDLLNGLENLTALSESGRYSATACSHGHAIVWDTAGGVPQHFGIDCDNSFVSILEPSLSSDGTVLHHRIATVENAEGLKATIRVLDTGRNGKVLSSISSIPLMRELMSPDGQFLVIAVKTDTGAVVEIRNLSTLSKIDETIYGVSDSAPLAFSPKGHLLAIGKTDGSIVLIDFRGKVLGIPHVLRIKRRAQPRLYPISAIAFGNLEGRQLLAYGEDGYNNVVRVVELEQSDIDPKVHFDPAAHLLWSDYFGKRAGGLVFSPDDVYLGLALDENTARVKLARTGFETARVTHSGRVLSIVFSPDKTTAFSGSESGELFQFPLVASKSTELSEYGCADPQQVSVDGNGRVASVSCVDHLDVSKVRPSVRLFEIDKAILNNSRTSSKELFEQSGEPFPRNDNTGSLCLTSVSTDGHRVAVGCNANITVYDVITKHHWSLSPREGFQAGDKLLHDKCQNEPTSLALNENGSDLAVGDDCGWVEIFHADQKSDTLSRTSISFDITAVRIFLEQQLQPRAVDIATAWVTRLLTRRSAAPRKNSSLLTTSWSITSLAFSPDDKLLSVGTDAGILWVQEVSKDIDPRWAVQLDGVISSSQFSEDSKKLIVAAGSAAHILSTSNGESLRHTSQQGDVFTTVAFAPGGERAAAGTKMGTIDIFELSMPGPAKVADIFENWLSSSTPAADEKISGLHSVYALRFPRSGNEGKKDSTFLAVWTNREQNLAPTDEQERDNTLALDLHDFDIDDRAQGICRGLREDLAVSPGLDFSSVCNQK